MTLSFLKKLRVAILRSAVLGAGVMVGSAIAEPGEKSATADVQLTLQARNALWQESPFDKLNLGVSVKDGLAILSGPVPSTAVADLAVAKLRNLSGIRGVTNETYVPPADEAMAKAMPHPVTARRPSVSVGPAVTAPEPVAPPPPAVAVAPPSRTTESLSPAFPVRRMTVLDQIESLRLDDRRFQNVRVEVKNGVVVLRGSVIRSADAWEFATTVRQIPGVTGVVQAVETTPR
jgi:osmotically-inducible protein OsmY